MKSGIHPEYHQLHATCVCGNTIATGSTSREIKMEICSACHPFYTGTQKIIDTEGRVEKFKKRYTQAESTGKNANKAKSETKSGAKNRVKSGPEALATVQSIQPDNTSAAETEASTEPEA